MRWTMLMVARSIKSRATREPRGIAANRRGAAPDGDAAASLRHRGRAGRTFW
jgi:hypothetical protein